MSEQGQRRSSCRSEALPLCQAQWEGGPWSTQAAPTGTFMLVYMCTHIYMWVPVCRHMCRCVNACVCVFSYLKRARG